ncbi:MAG: HAD-IC family P-type ATPase [Acidothermus sp.]|nr:HAD-IC family P-type ATPase [Acidothermus sp.]
MSPLPSTPHGNRFDHAVEAGSDTPKDPPKAEVADTVPLTPPASLSTSKESAGASDTGASEPHGLSTAEVADRRARGLINQGVEQTSRSVLEILRANVFTRFNALLGALFVIILIVGPIQDGLFGIVLVVNTAIGVFQELRAKRTLDRLAVVTAPRVTVRRDGASHSIPAREVVADEVIELRTGEQIVVDGEVVTTDGLEVDESLLTGESDPVAKRPGDRVLSGSFVVAGAGIMRATEVGAASYGARLAAEARRFTLVRSELRDGTNRILRVITWVLVPVAVLLAWSQLVHNHNLPDAIRGSVAGTVTMVPEGLVLLTSIAFAMGVIRLAARRVVVRELPAVEGLARIDVLCIDKTGTLTTGKLRLEDLRLLGNADAAESWTALAALVRSDHSPNATIEAIRVAAEERPEGQNATSWNARSVLAFSSARKFSGADFGERGVWLLGAPDVLLRNGDGPAAREAGAAVEELAETGRRTLLLARAQHLPLRSPEFAANADGVLADHGPLTPVAIVVLRDELREDAADTLAYLASEGVRVKVISGDHPRTVEAIARQLALADLGEAVDARTLPSTDGEELRAAVEKASIFGRVTPHQKRAMVKALQAQGHIVAMTGDGVNDVLALKDADLGVAMGSGTAATRGVAQLVLLDNAFSALPAVIAEGRRVIANVERVANLFLTKTVYATVLALTVGVVQLPFPFLPRHLTLVSGLTIGIPSFFLALAPNATRARSGFVGRVLRFAVPAGLVAAAATFGAYSLARSEPTTTLEEARTVATLVLAGIGLWILSILARPATRPRQWLVASMIGLLVLALVVPWSRSFFALELPRPVLWLAGVGVAGLAGLVLEAGWLAAGSIQVVVRARPWQTALSELPARLHQWRERRRAFKNQPPADERSRDRRRLMRR